MCQALNRNILELVKHKIEGNRSSTNHSPAYSGVRIMIAGLDSK